LEKPLDQLNLITFHIGNGVSACAIEKAQEGKNTILSWFGKGDLAKAKKELASRDEQIAKLKNQIKTLMSEKSQLKEKHREEIEQLRNGYQKEIDKAIRMAEKTGRQSKAKDSVIDKLNLRIEQLDRKANPQRYSIRKITSIRWFVKIWHTKLQT
jgi:predicted RNase H-like nuclease (RuvC/YqgF family)